MKKRKLKDKEQKKECYNCGKSFIEKGNQISAYCPKCSKLALNEE